MKLQKFLRSHAQLYIRGLLTDRPTAVCGQCWGLIRCYSGKVGRKKKRQNSAPLSIPGSVAGDVVRTVLQEQSPDGLLVQCNPDDLQLTQEFARHGARNIIIIGDKAKVEELGETVKQTNHREFFAKHGSDVSLRVSYLHNWPTGIKNGPMEEIKLLDTIPPHVRRKWKEDVAISVLGPAPCLSLRPQMTNYLVNGLSHVTGLYLAGRVNWFLFMHPSAYKTLYSPSQFIKKEKVLYPKDMIVSALYDIKHCLTLCRLDFHPEVEPDKRRGGEGAVQCGETQFTVDDLVLLQLTPRADMHDYVPPEDIRLFYVFLQEMFRARTNRLVVSMELVVPGCGLNLIDSGFNMAEEVWQVSPRRMLILFKKMQSWPEFKNSPLEHLFWKNSEDDTKKHQPSVYSESALDEDEHDISTVKEAFINR